jgi:hypothetical protein
MDFFFGSSASQPAAPPDPTHTIDRLCDRVKDATLLEDRRTAVQGLRGLARDWKLVLYEYLSFSKLGRRGCLF